MKVLSLFDGISCARVALERAGIPIELYLASEVDKYAIQISQKNYPDIKQLGDIKEIKSTNGWFIWNNKEEKEDYMAKIGEIDLLIGGSPCQDLSIAKKNRKGLNGERSGLFWEYVRILRMVNPKWFILENVASMPKEAKETITKELGVEPIMINAALVSAQNRKRLFWTNIPNVTQPEDNGIFWGDVQLVVTERCFYYSDKAWDWINKHEKRTGKIFKIWKPKDKAQMLEATMYKKYSAQRFFGIDDPWRGIRYITPIECERLQGLPDNYSDGVSNTQRYKTLGNAFNVDVVAHILSFIPRK